ncbi:DExH-box splicing factor binding site-domain-containing protein [Paraphoma chrysanthemicola]|nr:DExH-box splicing factor binding site-domain-containing protein [Paraphoma chrysanthemicola]
MAAPKEGGFKMSLGGLKGKMGLKASPAQKEVKRPRLALGDDEEDDSNKKQEIAGWDASEGGAIDIGGKKEKEGPRIIPTLPNRNWRDDARRKKLAKAPHTKEQNAEFTEAEGPKIQYGLTILSKDDPQENGAEEQPVPVEPMDDVKDNLTEEQRLEKKAMDALINGKATDDDRVIPAVSEEDILRNDLREAPDAPTLEAYEATPIEGFGAALLRGMGWKDGDATGSSAPGKPKEFKRRPALLGIGAKEEAATGVEIGDFKSRGKGKKLAQGYNPVALRNKITGEIITEDQLKAKLEQQDLVPDEKPAKQRQKHSDDEEEDGKRRERRREKKDDRRRDDEYDSERRSRKDDRRREKDEYYDSDRRRDKRKDKYRDDEYDSERRRDRRRDKYDDYDSERRREKRKNGDRRDRTRSPEDDRLDKKRDRYRSRSRDSKRDRDRRDRSRDSDDRRKRRKEKEYDYDDGRDDKKRRQRDEKY